MDEHEKYVRERWQYVSEEKCAVVIHELPYYGHGFRFTGLKDRWVRARAFTVERERQIAEVKEEIKEISHAITEWKDDGDDDTYQSLVYKRILSLRLQPVLDALKQGMKQ